MFWYDANTLVLKTDNINKTKTYFEAFGLKFVKEQHGNGAEHYSCQSGEKLLEIYPK